MTNVRMRRFLLLVGFLCLSAVVNAEWQGANGLWYEWIDKGTKAAVKVIQVPNNESAYSGSYTIPANILSPEDPEVSVPVTEIAVSAFKGATDLTDVIIEATITTIGKETFKNSGLTSIVLPPTLEEIGTNAFENTQLANISIPATVTYIGGSAFNNCTKLKKATFDSIEALCGITFDGSTSNPLYYAHDLYFGDSKITLLSIPATVTSIPAYAFQNCTSLTEVTIQEEQEGEVLKGVTTIGASAFAGCTSLASISIPSTVTNIGSNAFNIKSVVTEGERKAIFASFESLYNINFIDKASNPLYFAGHLYVGNSNQEKTEVTLPSTKNIKSRIFSGANNITKVTIPAIVEYIGDDAFFNCNKISTVVYDSAERLKKMKYGAGIANPLYYGATPSISGQALGTLSFTDNIEDNAFTNAQWLTDITIGPNVKKIGKNAFKSCSNLSKINYEGNSTLESIGDEAFYGCGALKSIDIPSTVTSIGTLAFRECKISNIIIPAACTKLGTSIFENCTALTEATFLSSEKPTTLPNYIFKGCNNLATITIPEKVDSIGEGAFYGCVKLATLPITSELTTICKNAFLGCTSIVELVLSDKGKLNTIGEGAFRNCTNLTMVSLPATIDNIYKYAFGSCTKLADVYIYKEELPSLVFDESFGGRQNEITLHVNNDDAKTLFENSSTIWAEFAKIVTKSFCTLTFYFNDQLTDPLTNKTYSITEEAGKPIQNENLNTLSTLRQLTEREDFSGWWNNNGKIVQIPSIMPSENMSFYSYYSEVYDNSQFKYYLQPAEEKNGRNLKRRATIIGNHLTQSDTDVEIDENIGNPSYTVDSIAPNALAGVEIYTLTLPNTIKGIGGGAFMNCSNLMSVNIPCALDSISDNLFEGCTALNSITIPETVTKIGYQAFCNSGLSEITIPASINRMNEEVFKNCKSLETVVFDDGFDLAVPKHTFWNCTRLTNVTLRGSMKAIGMYAFQNCDSIRKIDFIPDGISTISSYAFANCDSLNYITLPHTITNIGPKAFTGCPKLIQITVNTENEESAPSAANDAFDYTAYDSAILYVKNEAQYSSKPWNRFVHKSQKKDYDLTYKVDGETYKIGDEEQIIKVPVGDPVKAIDEPQKEGHLFSGWNGVPAIMPGKNVTVTGNFQYMIKYYDGSIEAENRILEDKDFRYFYGDKVTIPTEELDSIGYTYTLTGLLDDEVSEYNVPGLNMTMPAKDLNVIVTYKKIEITEDGVTYKIVDVESNKHAEVVSANKDITDATIKASIEYEGTNYPVTIIQQGAFKRLTKLKSVTFEENSNVNTICDEAFSYCSALAEINNLPLSLDSIGQQAFGNIAITSRKVPATQKMGKEIFLNCTKLKQVEFADDLTIIPERTFYGCNSIEVVDLNNIKTIDDYAFYGCVSIQSLSIPDCVTKIGDHAFWNVFGEGDNIVVLGTSLPTAQQTTFDDTAYDKASLTVSVETEDIVAWGEFHYQEGDITSLPCDDPVISNDNGKLYVTCPTDNATIVISVTVDDVNGKERRVDNLPKDQASEITLKKTIKVTAYATKEHMRRSKTVEKTYKFEDVNLDGKINTVDATEILKMLVE